MFSVLHTPLETGFDLVAPASVDLIFADMPYGESNKSPFIDTSRSYKQIDAAWDKISPGDLHELNGVMMRGAFRVLKKGGVLALTCSVENKLSLMTHGGTNTRATGEPLRAHHEADGGVVSDAPNFRFLNEVTWFKPNSRPFVFAKQLGRMAPSCEYVLLYSRGIPKTFHYEWLKDQKTDYEKSLMSASQQKLTQMKDFWVMDDCDDFYCGGQAWVMAQDTQSATGETRHPAQKPLALLTRIVGAFSNPQDFVLDPCCGSGTTGDAAVSMKRNFLGFDKEAVWAQASAERCLQREQELRPGSRHVPFVPLPPVPFCEETPLGR